MKKILSLVTCMILLIGTISALTVYEKSIYDKITDPIVKIKYAISHGFFGLFTTWGQQNGCSVNPDWKGWIRGSMSRPTSLPTSVSCSKVGKNKCAIDIWYDNTIYIGTAIGPPSSVNWNNWLKEVAGTGVSFSSTARPYYYIEIYGCPDTPPPTSTHDTKAYVCQNGAWSSKGSYGATESCSWDTSGTNRCWCSSSSDNFYVDSVGGVHCRPSTYSSVTNGAWCPAYVSHYAKTCYNDDVYWYDNNNQITDLYQDCSYGCSGAQCNSPPVTPVCKTEADTNCNGIIERSELQVYIDKWINNQITRDVFGNTIQLWAS